MTRDEIDAAIDAALKGLFPNAEHVPNTVGGLLNLAIWNAACDACAKLFDGYSYGVYQHPAPECRALKAKP